jgi:hypothetical protein
MSQQKATLTFKQDYLVLGHIAWTKKQILDLVNNTPSEDSEVNDFRLDRVELQGSSVHADYPMTGDDVTDEYTSLVIECYIVSGQLDVHINIHFSDRSSPVEYRSLNIPKMPINEDEPFVFAPLSIGARTNEDDTVFIATADQPANERRLMVTCGPVLIVFEDISVTILQQL